MFGLQFDRGPLIWAVIRLLPALDRLTLSCSTVEEHQIFPNSLFPWAARLEANWQAIRAEADVVLKNRRAIPPVRNLSPEHRQIAVDDRWRSYFLWGYGMRWKTNCDRCPKTAALLDEIPDLLSAFFSLLLPGTHIPRHVGPTKAILTTHLGLKVPRNSEACRMQLGDQALHWQEGRLFVFDDTYPHEVWNDTGEDRIVLLLHINRPQRFPGSMLRDGFLAALRHSRFMQDGLRNLEDWEKVLKDRAASL
jgi:ornithine lipid ester-linked acyl 2-hydroxylase